MALAPEIIQELLKHDGGRFAVQSEAQAYAFCSDLTKSHYENFPVASLIIDSKRRKHVHAIYAFARLADDVADQLDISADEKSAILDEFASRLDDSNPSTHPVFTALHRTIRDFSIDTTVLKRLLHAFAMDSHFEQANDWPDLMNYCSYSADPIGELILTLFRERDGRKVELSNNICSALQLINFWQDFSRDIPEGRFYIPRSELLSHNLTSQGLAEEHFSAKFPVQIQDLLTSLYGRTEQYLYEGSDLISEVSNLRLRFELCLTVHGAKRILEKSRGLGSRIFHSRPSLGTGDGIIILIRSLIRFVGISI